MSFEREYDPEFLKKVELIRVYFPNLLTQPEDMAPNTLDEYFNNADFLRRRERLDDIVSDLPGWVREFAEMMLLSAI